jgi:hypothetical protein
LRCDGVLDLLTLVKLKTGDEGAARSDGPTRPGEHPRGAAGTLALVALLFLRSFYLERAALAGVEDGLFGASICAVYTLYTVYALWAVDNGDGDRFRGEDGFRLFGNLAQDALARFGRRRRYVRDHGVGGEIPLQFGNFAAAEVAGLRVNLGLTHTVVGQKLEREEYEVVFRDVIADRHASSSFLRLNRALRIRVFTVPKGSPVISAISE